MTTSGELGAPSLTASSSRWFAARLPCIFQLPATSRSRIRALRQNGRFYPPDGRPVNENRGLARWRVDAQPERDRPVIDEAHLHLRAKLPRGHRGMAGASQVDGALE